MLSLATLVVLSTVVQASAAKTGFGSQVSCHLLTITLSHPNVIQREFYHLPWYKHQAPTASTHILLPMHRNSGGTSISSTLVNYYLIIRSICILVCTYRLYLYPIIFIQLTNWKKFVHLQTIPREITTPF